MMGYVIIILNISFIILYRILLFRKSVSGTNSDTWRRQEFFPGRAKGRQHIFGQAQLFGRMVVW